MKVLVLAQRLPYAPNRGDRVRVYHMMREVAAHAQVDVGALVHDEEEASHATDLSDIAGEVELACVIGYDARGFASALIRFLKCSPRERGERAYRADLTPLLWSTRLKPLLPLLEEATCTSAVLPNLARGEVLATSV